MRKTVMFAVLALCCVAAFAANILFGAVHLPVAEILESLSSRSEESVAGYIVWENRLPQAVAALLGGAALALTGLMMQTAFRNPLAGPSILGISSGASLGVAVVMLLFGGLISFGSSTMGGYVAIVVGALVGSLAITAILTAISLKVKNALMLLIVGILTGYLTSSVVTLLSSISTARNLQGYVMWGMGSFSGVSLSMIPWFSGLVLTMIVMSLLLAKPLNILLLGDAYARNLGVRIGRVKTYLLLATGILTAVVTAFCGPVAFIGLAMPHIARMMMRDDNHWVLMPASMLCGSVVALVCSVVSVAISASVIPLNALTPIVGVPVILYVILKRQ